MPEPPTTIDGIDVAFICTGNICRSPMAEAILRARLAARSIALTVGSAGLLFDGRPAEPRAVKTLGKRGLDLQAHRAQTISVGLLADTSLILGMERQHVREVTLLRPDLFDRSFTLPEFVTLATLVGARSADESLRDWAERIGRMRVPADYAYGDPASEVRDPYGHSGRVYRDCADLLETRIDELVALAWPVPHPSDPVAPAPLGGTHADRNRR